MRAVLVLLAALACVPARAADPGQVLRDALNQARAKHQVVLVDFFAPWCYSCYYMARNVLNGPEWNALGRKAVVLQLDGDSPEGHAWMENWDVRALPTYILLRDDGSELDRILGEQTRADFYTRVNTALGQADSFGALQARVRDGSADALVAAREVLRLFHARNQGEEGLAWYLRLPVDVRAAVGRDAAAGVWLARLELLRAAKAKDGAACLQAAPAVLAADLGCERSYELDRVLACTADQPAAARAELLRPEAARMQALVDKRVFAPNARCADERSAVVAAADLDEALGDQASHSLVLSRAAAEARKRLNGDLRSDRNLADNLRAYLEVAKNYEALDQLYPQLVAAYSDDYVYAYRYGKNLAARGDHKAAMKWFAQSYPKAYGLNRLKVAEQWAKSYEALGHPLDGQQILAQALAQNAGAFPEDVEQVKALQQELLAAAKAGAAPK